MEETPICASVEKDLEITVDELATGAPLATAPADAATPDGDRISGS
ncbi:hypothetical protein [Nocardioides sp. YIM 152315]|nr:hypothetical protein [Nocardioides sp. YIM 152315]MDF1606252.1 hypothetical protein [Nocardioides sp. YIM 152315]